MTKGRCELHQLLIYIIISIFYVTTKHLRDVKCLFFPLLFSLLLPPTAAMESFPE